MTDVEYENADFAEAVSQVQDAGDPPSDGFCPAYAVVGSATVEAALAEVDAVVRTAMTALASVGDQLARDTATIHAEWQALDAALGGAGG